MKGLLIGLVGLALITPTAFAYLGQVVGSFVGPHYGSAGLAISRDYLYVMRSYCTPNYVFRCNPLTGSILGTFHLYATDYFYGLAYSSDGYVWAGDVEHDRVYRIDAKSGRVNSSWSCPWPSGLAPRCTGDGGLGTTHILSTAPGGRVFVHNMTTGSVTASFSVAHPSEHDCAYDWRNDVLWLPENDSPYFVYGYRFGGSILASFANPNPQRWELYGLTYKGEYLWFSCPQYPSCYIYRIHCPAGIGVAPASVGKVKALFR